MWKRFVFGWTCLLGLALLSGMIVVGCGPTPGEEQTCTYNGKTYKMGETFPSTDGCNTCACVNGEVSCTLRACAPQPCGAKGTKPCPSGEFCDQATHCGANDKAGECKKKPDSCTGEEKPVCGCNDKTYSNACVANAAGASVKTEGKCQDAKKTCEYGGKTYNNGDKFPSTDGCNTCTCTDGKVDCSADACPFKGCTYGGKTYKSGEQFPKGDGCNNCNCFDGKVTCTDDSCTKKSCAYEGNTYEHNKSFPSKDGCNTCKCDDGKVTCSTKACPKPCTYEGKTYKHEEQFPATDGCNTCTCTDGKVSCTEIVCPTKCKSNSDCDRAQFCKRKDGACGDAGQCTVRPQNCPNDTIDYVCGCDRQTYKNACQAYAAGTSVIARGKCPTTPQTCTHNGQTYNDGDSFPAGDGCNTCTCKGGLVACTKIACPPGACQSDKHCKADEYCHFPSGTCGGNGKCSNKPTGCPRNIAYVCGCNGNTYANSCLASAAGTSVKSTGKCPSTGKTCTHNGQTYNDGDSFPAGDGCNRCTCKGGLVVCTKIACPPGACQNSKDCKSDEYCAFKVGVCSGPGTCTTRPTACNRLYDPVCGCDGKTYGNACSAASAGVSVKAKGACSSTCSGCTSNRNCKATDYCKFPTGQCSTCGTCTTKPTQCTQIYKPVCGCDKQTHSNSCVAASKGVSVMQTGACAP